MVPPRGEFGELSDRELVLAFQSAHPDAYDEIFRRHSERVRRVCSKMLRDPHDAEEATQETFLRGYKALGRFNGRYQLGAWLARIATNVCLDEIRKSRTHVSSAPMGEAEDHEVITAPTSELVVERTEVARSMGEIAPLHARALMLQAVEGLSHKEMAGELEMTAPQVKSLLHRARRSFRAAWQEASGWVIAPTFAFRSLMSRDESQPAGEVTAGATAQLSSAFVERLATGTVAAVLAIGGFGLGTDPLINENPRNETIARKARESGSLHTRIRKVTGAERRGTTIAGAQPVTTPQPPNDLRDSLALGVSGDLPTTDGDGGRGSGRTIDLGPTTTGQGPVDEAVRDIVDLANDTIEAGNGTAR
jgi:RNA polymerase sigma factor (sigma-70 family)